MWKFIIATIAVVCLFRVKTVRTLEPSRSLWGNPELIRYDPKREIYINHNPELELWRLGTPYSAPEEIPARHSTTYVLHFAIATKPEPTLAMAAILRPTRHKRFVLINVEQTLLDLTADSDKQYRTWPHLGILYVGTAAHEEGWDVTLWDELVQGHCDLSKLVTPGDVVGLSLVVTGVERGIELAKQAKALGASAVIAGNDSAIFRANEILSLPGRPIDAVFTSNSLASVRGFFRQFGTTELQQLQIPGVSVQSGDTARSNARSVLLSELNARKSLKRQGAFDAEDVFIVPKLDLYQDSYWEEVWSNYRQVFGHKHRNGEVVRNGIALFAQGCTRTRGTDVCSYCTIAGVGDVRIPSEDYLRRTLEAYERMGIRMIFNTTDSAFEMRPLVQRLQNVGASFDALTIYGRAQGIATQPELLDSWLSLVEDRLLVNVGMDSGDGRILAQGVVKSSLGKGSRIQENYEAVRNIRKSGAHLHYSLIFGSPGETVDSCERSIEFLEWSIAELGSQLDLVETDLYWLNFGSPVSEVFTSYEKARTLAAIAGKEISLKQWHQNFGRHATELVVPTSAEEAWFHYFTNIDIETARAYNRRASTIMARHEGSITGRAYKPT
jgi:radical SAM superfamily enzyme YgiQ (UPF0313 family)